MEIFTDCTKEGEVYEDNVDCTRTATRDGNRHGTECQYCEQNNMDVCLEEREAPLKVAKKTLKTYTGDPVPVCGELEVWVDTPDGRRLSLPLVVVAGSGPSLLGRDWIREVQIDWGSVHLL